MMRASVTILAFFVTVVAACPTLCAQKLELKDIQKVPDRDTSTSATPGSTNALCNDAVKTECLDAWRTAFKHYTTALKQREQAYQWQAESGRIIFSIVIMLVIAGVVFAAIQFHHTLRTPKVSVASLDPTKPAPAMSELAQELEISSTGLKLKSSVLGTVILAISMGFFSSISVTCIRLKGQQGCPPRLVSRSEDLSLRLAVVKRRGREKDPF